MEWIIGIIVIGAAWYFFVMKKAGNLPFWKTAQQHPVEAMMFFAAHPHWHIERKPAHGSVSGPFLFVDPRSGQTLKIYCDSDHIEETQRQFMADSKQGFRWLRSLVNTEPNFSEKISQDLKNR